MSSIKVRRLRALFVALFIFGFAAVSSQPAAAVPKSALDTMKLESLKDGRTTPLGTLMKGRPFYVIMSTPT